MSMSRITITIPSELVEAADRKASELARSRSWVLVEALRAFLAGTGAGRTVHETPGVYTVGLGPSRQAQLEADLALSLEDRVHAAEETTRVAERRWGAPLRDRVISFERHEDFLRWEKREALDP